MKKTILKSAAAICLMAMVSCNNNAKNEGKNHEQPTKGIPPLNALKSSVRVPLQTAQNNIHRYDELCLKTFQTVPVRAYTIHSEDLLEVLGVPVSDSSMCKYKYARAYLGLDSANNFKLYLTPVEGADLDAVPKNAGKDVILKDEMGPYVLDLNAPCPMTCDQTSPLYTPKGNE